MERPIITILSSILLLSASGFLIAADVKKPINFETTELTPGIYMISGTGGFAGGNIGLSIGNDGVVMIDDSMPPLLDKIKIAVRKITDKPVDFLINTHIHGDHTGNNASLGEEGIRIVAHENLRKRMLAKSAQMEGKKKRTSKAALPVITFSQAMNFHLNGEDARVFHVENAHTDGDAIIRFINANVIHAGDTFFNGMFPYIDLDNGGSINGYISAQKKTLALSNEQTKIIPGHGPLANKKQLKASLEMLIDSRKLISALAIKGLSEDAVVKKNPLQKYHDKWSWSFITTEKMTRQLYKSLTTKIKPHVYP